MMTPLKVALIVLSAWFVLAHHPASGNEATEAGPEETGAVIVTIELLKFPEEVAVTAGTTVRWVNKDNVAHDVTSGTSITGRKARGKKKVKFHDGKFKSNLFPKGETFEFTFTEKGEYSYYCNIHPFMVGKIVVE